MHSLASSTDLVMATVFVAVAAILITGSLLANVMARFHQPAVIGEIAAGIMLGPSLLGLLPGDLSARLFPADIKPMLSAIAQIGLLLFIFLIGWEFEKNLLADRRLAASAVSASSVLLAFGLGAGLGLVLYPAHSEVAGQVISRTAFILFMGAAMSITAFPVLARILTDSGLINTRVGALALAIAAVDDVIAWCLLAFVSATVTAGNAADLLQIGALSAGYVLAMFLVVRPFLVFVVKRFTREQVSPYLLLILAAGVFISAYATTWIGIHAIFGAFLFGFVMPREPGERLGTHLRRPLEVLCTLLLPVFFIATGLNVDITGLSARNYLELVAIIVVACAGKLIGAVAPALAFGLPWPEARTLGILMNTRGLTELIILNAGVQLGVLDSELFTMMVIMALVTTAAAGPLLPRGDRAKPQRAAAPSASLRPAHI